MPRTDAEEHALQRQTSFVQKSATPALPPRERSAQHDSATPPPPLPARIEPRTVPQPKPEPSPAVQRAVDWAPWLVLLGGGGAMGGGASVAVRQRKPEAVEVDPVVDALVPPGWLRVLRSDNIEGFIRVEQRKRAGTLQGYYAEKAVGWHLSLADAREGKAALGIIPRGSALIGLEVTPMDPNKPLERQFARFLAEVSPKVEGFDPSLVLRADEASITDPEEQRPEEFRAIEAWVRVSDEPDHSMDGLLNGGMAPTVVKIASANKPWPIPTL
eukprot:COSAG03_NODE_7189_length_952_cov_1.505275_1_plen_271_part_10